MNAKELLSIYNTILSSHKALPKDAHERLSAGERVTIYNGTEHAWTSKLVLVQTQDTLTAEMIIAENLPERIKAQLQQKQTQFRAQVRP